MNRTNLVTAGIFVMLMSATNSASSVDLQIQGKSLFTFSRRHFVVQAEKVFYQIEKKGVPPATLSKLEQTAVNGGTIAFSIPRSKIEYIWPNPDSVAAETVSATAEESTAEAGRIVLRGTSQLSFSEEHFLVQDQDSVYQIAKSALSEKEIGKFAKAGPGASLVITVPEAAIQGTWSFKQNPSRTLASFEEPDAFEFRDSLLIMRGTILYSADNQFVIVQSGSTVYRLRRNGIATNRPELLDLNGSRVNLTVAVANIAASW